MKAVKIDYIFRRFWIIFFQTITANFILIEVSSIYYEPIWANKLLMASLSKIINLFT